MTSFERNLTATLSALLFPSRESEFRISLCSGILSVEPPILCKRGPREAFPMHFDVRNVPTKNDRGSSDAFSSCPQKLFLSNMPEAFYCGHRGSPASKKKAGVQPFRPLWMSWRVDPILTPPLIIKDQRSWRHPIG
jgi:hypothetical protein